MATERPSFKLLERFERFEVREYPQQVVAETTVDAERSQAGAQGFRRLAGYIFGGNRGSKSIAMTAPVSATRGQKIAMTAPVSQTAAAPNRWVIQFTMPSEFTLQALPEPLDERVRLRAIGPRRVAVLRYSGQWSEGLYEKELTGLKDAIAGAGMKVRGEATWARYDPPWTPWFLRTNEIQLELEPPTADQIPSVH